MVTDRELGCNCCGLPPVYGLGRAECGHWYCQLCEDKGHHDPCTVCSLAERADFMVNPHPEQLPHPNGQR